MTNKQPARGTEQTGAASGSELDFEHRKQIAAAMRQPERIPSAEQLDDAVRKFVCARLRISTVKNSWWDIARMPKYRKILTELDPRLRRYVAGQVAEAEVYAEKLAHS